MDAPTSQADKRRDIVAEDQFGRPWLYSMENETMEPTGLIDPSGWADPMRTPQKYLSVPRTKFGQPQLGTLKVDLVRWIEDQTRALQEWKLNLWNIGNEKYKGAKVLEEFEADPYIKSLAGPTPWPTVEALEAALAGHRGLLGLVPLVVDGVPNAAPEAVEARALLGIRYLHELMTAPPTRVPIADSEAAPVTYRAFVADARKRGKSMSEAAELWREHKAALQEA